MTKERILAEIKRTAEQNGGVALGQRAFVTETGIAKHSWQGKFWLTWSDALAEGGFEPNRASKAEPKESILLRLGS
jgi:hypothetical protein